MSFKNYFNNKEKNKLCENDGAKVVFAFGRFQPPTKGHELLINKVIEEAKKQNAHVLIFSSQVVDKKRNPLDWKQKNYFLRELFPNVNFVMVEKVKSPWQAVDYLSEQGYTNITMVAGSDRIPEFKKRLANYAKDLVKKFTVVSSGKRDPDDNTIGGMSGTNARQAAASNNLGKFRALTGWHGEIAERLMKAVQQGMLK